MPRLLIASGIVHPEPGGPSTWLQELLPALQARGWQLEVLSYGAAAPTQQPWPLQRIPRRVLPLRMAHYATAAWPRLRRNDLVLVTTPGLPLPGGRAPRVYRVAGDQAWERSLRRGWIPPDEDIERFQQRRYSALVELQKAARAHELRRAHRVIVPGNWLRELVLGWGVAPARVHVIPNALPEQPPVASGPELAGEEARAFAAGAPLLLTAGRLTRWKGVDLLLEALTQVPEPRLLVAGDGPQRAALQRQAARLGLDGRVRFTGRLSRAQLARCMQAADWLVLYSGYEGLSHTLLESLRAGTPVIVSDRCGNPEVVTPGHNGLLVPWPDVEALAATLRQALHAGLRARLARNTQEGLQRFSFTRMVAQTDALLRDCCQ